jgi:hypothetical protein
MKNNIRTILASVIHFFILSIIYSSIITAKITINSFIFALALSCAILFISIYMNHRTSADHSPHLKYLLWKPLVIASTLYCGAFLYASVFLSLVI